MIVVIVPTPIPNLYHYVVMKPQYAIIDDLILLLFWVHLWPFLHEKVTNFFKMLLQRLHSGWLWTISLFRFKFPAPQRETSLLSHQTHFMIWSCPWSRNFQTCE
jgi:hypothetical protein